MNKLPLSLVAVLSACLSSILGGSAIVATRYVVPEAGVPATILLRFAGASVLMLAFTLPRMPIRVARGDAPVIVALGLVQFAVFPWLFTTSLSHIPAARAAMVLSTQPLFTLAFSAAVGRERLSVLKVIGGVIALVAVAFALGDRVAAADADTWKGDLYMFGAVLSGSIYNVASGYALRRYRALVVASVMIPTGAVAIAALVLWRGDWAAFANISAAGWFAVLYLTSFGGAITFFLWIWALEHTSPSRVALAVTLNPVSAAVLGAVVLAEPVGERLLVGVAGVVGALVLVNWSAIMKSVGRGPRL
ncbi:MAG: DMT family transporter [Betaproteobacteria bacterium]